MEKEVEKVRPELRVDFGEDDGKEEGRRRRRRHRRQMGRRRWKGTPLACSEEWWAGRWRERIPSPRWHLLPLIITMVGDDDFWSWSPCLDDVSFTAPVASIVASSSVRSIVADSESFFYFYGRQERLLYHYSVKAFNQSAIRTMTVIILTQQPAKPSAGRHRAARRERHKRCSELRVSEPTSCRPHKNAFQEISI